MTTNFYNSLRDYKIPGWFHSWTDGYESHVVYTSNKPQNIDALECGRRVAETLVMENYDPFKVLR